VNNMKRTLLLLSFCVAIPISSARAGIIGSTSAAAFDGTNTIDWCQLGGCATDGTLADSTLDPVQLWSSLGGNAGFVAVVNGASLYNLVSGPDPALQDPPVPAPENLLISNFDQGMGVVSNGVDFGNSPGPIELFFLQDQFAVGAYISASFLGNFTATIEMFDGAGNSLGSYDATTGSQDFTPDNALFIGAFSSTAVRIVTFSATGTGGAGFEPDFAIGTARLGLGDLNGCEIDDDFCTQVEDEVPEPASFLLLTPALLGLAAFTRRRRG
jgi:hypothetical protein